MRSLNLLMVLLLSACGGANDASRVPVQSTGTIVFIGDSITQSWPLSNYVTDPVNAGVSGNETPQMLDRFDSDVLGLKPVLVVIDGGINDIRNRETTDCASLLAMVQKAHAANVKVIVGTLMHAENLGPDAAAKQLLIRAMNKEIRAAAESYGFDVVDYFKISVSSSGALNHSLFPDGLHPNPNGYDAMWNELLPALRRQGVVREGSG